MSNYHYLTDYATADIAFDASGNDLEEVFLAACDATMNVMIEDLESIDPLEKKVLDIQDDHLDMLLFNLLQELIYFKDAEQLLLRVKQITFHEDDGKYSLHAIAKGEKLKTEKHEQRADVKAVTLHGFNLHNNDKGWFARIILDI